MSVQVDWEAVLRQDLADPKMGRIDIAQDYRYLISINDPGTDWAGINQAIIARFGITGFRVIKDRAWSKKGWRS